MSKLVKIFSFEFDKIANSKPPFVNHCLNYFSSTEEGQLNNIQNNKEKKQAV
jgi:hypothetical protein